MRKHSLRRRAAAPAVLAAVAVLTAGCGVVHISFGDGHGSAATRSPTYQAALAYAHCMQTHGVPSFPDPEPSMTTSIGGHPSGNASGPLARANHACAQLLRLGSATASPG